MTIDRTELRAKWERYNARLDEGDATEGSLAGASFIIARSGVTDVLALLDDDEELLRSCLDVIAGCVVGWAYPGAMPEWARALWGVVNPLQAALGIPLTDSDGKPL